MSETTTRFELIIFDCDGVLVDSEIITCRIDARELGRLGFEITADEVAARFAGRPTQDMLSELEVEQGIPVPAGFRDHLLACVLDSFAGDLKLVPNVAAALARMTAPVCVASSSDVERIEKCLRITGLLGFFAPRIFSAQMVARGKPFPNLFQLAAQTLEVAPDACLVVENSTSGVAAIAATPRQPVPGRPRRPSHGGGRHPGVRRHGPAAAADRGHRLTVRSRTMTIPGITNLPFKGTPRSRRRATLGRHLRCPVGGADLHGSRVHHQTARPR
jgi:HAD superfamily hydrolase (TIGR01509 family)